jgi:multicomponent Na+:H+ antiporter subunit E
MPDRDPPPTPATGLSGWWGWLRRVALFAVLWWILTGGAADSWLVGAPVVVVAAWLSLRLWSRPLLSPLGLLRFLPWFAWQSLAGATDVALRAFRPAMPLYPGIVRYRLRLPPGAPRVMLADVVSMQPGTLSADLLDDELVIHALDARHDLPAMLRDMEPRIAAVFGLRLEPPNGLESRP